MINQAQLKH